MGLTERIGYIYKLTSPNNKIYIGQTINPIKRKSDYKKLKFKGQIKLWNNCQFHNWNPADTFEIIDECFRSKNGTDLDKLEIDWIVACDSFHNGLNCNEGGTGNKGHKYTEESKEKLSDTLKEKYSKQEHHLKGRPLTEEHKEKLSGKIPHNKGKIMEKFPCVHCGKEADI